MGKYALLELKPATTIWTLKRGGNDGRGAKKGLAGEYGHTPRIKRKKKGRGDKRGPEFKK